MSKFPDFLNQVGEKALMPLATNIGTTLADLWFIAFASISNKANIKRIEYAKGIEKLKQSTEERTSRIPSDDLKTPNIQIALQALEQAKFCVEEDILREMFAELIASSMMKSRETIVHPSFALLLSQMSPADARALMRFQDSLVLPMISVISTASNSTEYTMLLDNIWDVYTNSEKLFESHSTLNSLTRLGLIEINRSEWIANDEDQLYNELFTSRLQTKALSIAQTLGIEVPNISIKKGLIRLTAYGTNFISCVLPN